MTSGEVRSVDVLLVGQAGDRVRSLLEPLGLVISSVTSAGEAAHHLARSRLVLVTFDEAAALLRQRAPHLPVIVLDAPADATARLLEAGASDALSSSADEALLQARTRSLLSLTLSVHSAAQKFADEARLRAEAAQRVAEEATRLKDQFLSTLSHEMRTPLTAILGWVRLLRLGRASADPAGRALESIERNARLQAQLVNDLLDVQRMASGKMSLSFRDVEAGALLEAAVQASFGAAAEAGVRFRVVRSDEDLHVFGDPERLHQSLTSLLSNAVKFSEPGGEVRVHLQAAGTEVSIVVADEGRGIDPSFLPHAFEAFSQEEGGLARSKRGLGLGLSIVRHVIELHGGAVAAESEGEGKGARFTIALPLTARVARPSARPARRTIDSHPPPRSRLEGVRILVVEDDLDTQYLLATMLEQLGARVTSAGSAPEALGALQGSPFDLLLSDISMPGEDGYSLIRRIRSGAAQPRIPAAALTANARSEDRDQALRAGFQAHIAKPVDPLELGQILGGLVS